MLGWRRSAKDLLPISKKFGTTPAILIAPLFGTPGLPAGSNRLRGGRAETQYGNRKEGGAEHADKNELRPDHVDTGAAVKDRLRERHEMRRRRRLHDGAQERRHALERRVAPGKHIERHRYQYIEQTEDRVAAWCER